MWLSARSWSNNDLVFYYYFMPDFVLESGIFLLSLNTKRNVRKFEEYCVAKLLEFTHNSLVAYL